MKQDTRDFSPGKLVRHTRFAGWAATFFAAGVVVSWSAEAVSQLACDARLYCFGAGTPAVASEVNSNFAEVTSWIEQKVGTVGTNDVAIGGTATVSGSTTLSGSLGVTGATTASGPVSVPTSNLSFGTSTRQMVNLWGTDYGIGIQSSTQYYRTGGNFAWYLGGVHNDGALNPGGGTRQMYLDGSGTLFTRGAKQTDNGSLTSYEVSTGRYVREATPTMVGTVQPLDPTLVNALCRDDDGCGFTIAMVNWDSTGSVASRSGRLFLSQSTNAWRLEVAGSDFLGTDANGAMDQYAAWDCYFGDAQQATDTNNGRSDSGTGFGFLNCRGCDYSDTMTTCRLILID